MTENENKLKVQLQKTEKTPKYMYETTQFMPPNGFHQLHGTKHATERMPKKTAIKYATDLS